MKIRNVAVVVLGALMSAAGYAHKDHAEVALLNYPVPLSLFIMCIAVVAWSAFYFMDRHWYHRLLYGAVKHGQKVEASLKSVFPEIDLTASIGKESPVRLFGKSLHSTHKIDIFYGSVAAVILMVAVVLSLSTNLNQR